MAFISIELLGCSTVMVFFAGFSISKINVQGRLVGVGGREVDTVRGTGL